ncbi:hypothetical protein F5B19DRAFT_478873 [Rostrohypoxylon terebratum]|nr:hypothetical protein F5B19DRAFT_478873 [Rostrohypoxylon terebratum]
MASTYAREADKAAEESGFELVRGSLKVDVLKRAVISAAPLNPCACGKYQYFSQKCGHPYKSVHLKCGKMTSAKTGRPVLCPAGRQRVVNVETAVVPYYCQSCRQSGVRWTRDLPDDQGPAHPDHADHADHAEYQGQPTTSADQQQEQIEATSTYPDLQLQPLNATLHRGRDEKENERELVNAGEDGDEFQD